MFSLFVSSTQGLLVRVLILIRKLDLSNTVASACPLLECNFVVIKCYFETLGNFNSFFCNIKENILCNFV